MKILIGTHHLPPNYKGGAEGQAFRTVGALQELLPHLRAGINPVVTQAAEMEQLTLRCRQAVEQAQSENR